MMEVMTTPLGPGSGPADSGLGPPASDSGSPGEDDPRISAEVAGVRPPAESSIPQLRPDSDVAPKAAPDPRSEWRLEDGRLGRAKLFALAHLAALFDAVEAPRGEDALIRAATDMVQGFGLRPFEAVDLLNNYSIFHGLCWLYTAIRKAVSAVDAGPDEASRPRGWRLAEAEAEEARKLARDVDPEAVMRRGRELAEGGGFKAICKDQTFLEELAILEVQDFKLYKRISARYRRLSGWDQGEFDGLFWPHRAAVDKARMATGKGQGSRELLPTRHPPSYACQPGTMFVETVDANGEFHREQVADFDARIVESVARDDGAGQPERTFLVEARSDERPDVARTVSVPASEFDRMEWATPLLGPGFSIVSGRGCRDHARAAIQHASAGCPEKTTYLYTGWIRVDGRWSYLHGRGGIGAAGNEPSISVDLAGNAARFELPDPPEGADLADAIKASLGILGLADPQAPGSAAAAAVLFAATYRAAIAYANFSLQFYGETGCLKSSFASLGQQHFGLAMDAVNLPASWSSDTPLSIGDLATRIGDALLVVDEFKPRGSPQDISRKHSEAQDFFQAIGNHAGRQRLKQDGSPRPSRPPNCLPVSTGEDRIHGGSADARTLPVRFTAGMIDGTKLYRCQTDADSGLYAASMAAFIRWLAPRLDEVRAEMAPRVVELRGRFFQEGDHRRTPEILAHLTFGAEIFLRFALEVGAITPEESGRVQQIIEGGLAEASAEIRSGLAEELGTCDLFLSLIAAALTSGRAYLGRRQDDHAPDGIESICGWRHHRGDFGSRWEAAPGAERIGWVDGDNVLLQPDVAFAAARKVAEAGGRGFATTKQSLSKLLEDEGMLAKIPGRGKDRGGKKRIASRVLIGSLGRQVAVWPIPSRLIWPQDEEPEAVQAAG